MMHLYNCFVWLIKECLISLRDDTTYVHCTNKILTQKMSRDQHAFIWYSACDPGLINSKFCNYKPTQSMLIIKNQ